jgi:DNA-binding CsgD family transcriptional regulator
VVELDVKAFAADLQQSLREAADGGGKWRALVEQGLLLAYQSQDTSGLCEVVQAIVSILDAQGRQLDAIAEVEHAIAEGRDNPNALAMLWSMKATFEATTGQLSEARRSSKHAMDLANVATDAFARAKATVNASIVRLVTFDVNYAAGGPLIPDCGHAGIADNLFLQSYVIPVGLALGRLRDTHPRMRSFRLQATQAQHQYRLGDAVGFEAAEAVARGGVDLPEDLAIPRWNWLAQWRLSLLRLRTHLLRRDWDRARAEMNVALRARRHAGDADLDRMAGLEALFGAYFEDDTTSSFSPDPPDRQPHLLNLAGTLMTAEAVAIRGSQTAGQRWLDWLQVSLPTDVVTSCEWPVCRLRLLALLALRAGDVRVAKRLFDDARGWAEAHGYPVELATAKLQLGELLRHGTPAAEKLGSILRRDGTAELRTFAIDAAPQAHLVTMISPWRRQAELLPALTRRELEVLAALDRGLTYRAIAAELGVKWSTVQTLAHRCYEKLEVSGKQAAAARAREFGLL